MQLIHRFLPLTVLILCSSLFAEPQPVKQNTLRLQCFLSSQNYPSIKDFYQVQDIELLGPKTSPTGAVKVFHAKGYEFWTMTHTLQRQGNPPLSIASFQVAIKNSNNGWFAHALSGQKTNRMEPQSARISLVDYAKNSFFETGELLFECRTSLP